jgi:arylsulfatase A-like enzyme/GT2 family glycosyltransferase
VIIPVHNGRPTLDGCLRALLQSVGVEPDVVVVDDASTDGSGDMASRFPVRRITLQRRLGSAAARNQGAEEARAPILVFIDADVRVAPDTLSRMVRAFQEDPGMAALFGSYSADSPHTDFFSQYKNLHHHFIHRISRRDASTFWTGCGAIRREVFRALGGFPPQERPGPDLADLELGYRMRAAGYRIHLIPEIQVTHDKRYTLISLIRSDLFFRAIPWTRIMWRQRIFRPDLNTRIHHLASVLAMYVAILLCALPISLPSKSLVVAGALAVITLLNRGWVKFCYGRRGLFFAVGATAMEWLYFFYSGLGAILGTLSHWAETVFRERPLDSTWDHHAASQSRRYYLPSLLARHKGEVTLGLIRTRWSVGAPARRVLKTDLYEEAFGEDHLLFRRSGPWWSPRGVGIDVSMPVLRRARERAKESGLPWLGPVCADVRRLPFRAEVFDLILSTSTLDHFPCEGDLVDSCAELARVTDVHGALFLTMDNPRNPWIFLRNLPWVERAFRDCGILSVPLGRTLSWERMRGILAAQGWRCSAPSFLLHYPRALLIPVARHWRNAAGPIHRFIVALDRLGNTSCARTTGLYYTLWCRKESHASEPKSILDLPAPSANRKLDVYPLVRRPTQSLGASPVKTVLIHRRNVSRMRLQVCRLGAWGRFMKAWESAKRKKAPGDRGPSILWLSIDSLRPDHLGCYGYRAPTSPILDRLAHEGWLFRRAIAPAPWTLGAMGSLFTGFYPHLHGGDLLPSDLEGESDGPRVHRARPISEDLPTLAEILRAAGYRTAGFTQPGLLDGRLGFERGFQVYRDDCWGVKQLVLETVGWIGSQGTEPFFALLHAFNTHYPYSSPGRYRRRFGGGDPSLRLTPRWIQAVNEGRTPLPPHALGDLVRRYDAAIAYVDRWVGILLAFLRRAGLLDRTMVIVSADHGESFMEHNRVGHEGSLFNEVLWVPLVIRYPPWGIGIVGQQVRSLDLFPTILEAVGLTLPGPFHGESLLPLIRGEISPHRPAISQEGRGSPAFAFQDGEWKILGNPRKETMRLYRLPEDPGEQRDLSRECPERLAAMVKAAMKCVESPLLGREDRTKTETLPVEGDLARRLRGLGYL